MGSSRDSGGGQSSTVQTTQTTRPEPTPEEKELQKLQLARRQNVQPQLLELDQSLLAAIQPLSRGESLPGQFSSLGQGIPVDTQQQLVNRAIEQITPQLESLGILNSGITAELASRAATDIGIQSETERIRQQENLLNVLQGFPTQAQAPILQETSTLASQLAGLRPITTTGTAFQQTQRQNPSRGTFGFSFF